MILRKRLFRIGDLFSVLAVSGLWFYYRTALIAKADEVCLSLFGKNLTGRNPVLQAAVWSVLFLISVLIPILLERLISRDPKFTRLADGLILLILGIPAVQLAVICANQVLRRDDYWEIADARLYGFPGSMFYEIRQWNGRYTGWGLRSLHAILPAIPYIDIFLLLDLILLVTGTSMLAYRFLESQRMPFLNRFDRWIRAVLIGFGAGIVFILMSSNIWEFWFWGSGTMIYGFGLSMCILSTALVLKAADAAAHRGVYMVFAALTCFLTCGCSELCSVSLAAFLFMILVWRKISRKCWDKRVFVFLAEVCILLVCILLLTGTVSYAEDRAQFESDGDAKGLLYLLEWVWGSTYWAFSGLHGYTFIKYRELILFFCIAFLIGTQLAFDKKTCGKYLLIALFLTVIAHCVLMINSMLNYMPPRVITVGICWFVTAMALVCMLLGGLLTRGRPRWNGHIKALFCALLLCLAVSRFFNENIYDIRSIRSSWNIRNALLEQYQHSETAVTTCSLPSPGSFREDILEDPEDEFNKAAARFYQVPAISAEFRCPPYGESFITPDRYAEQEAGAALSDDDR